MQKWEYCAIGPITENGYPDVVSRAQLVFFTDSGQKSTWIGEDKSARLPRWDVLSRVIAQLGREGWEMAGCGTVNELATHVIYFKRPLTI